MNDVTGNCAISIDQLQRSSFMDHLTFTFWEGKAPTTKEKTMKLTCILLALTIFAGAASAQNTGKFVISDEAAKKSLIKNEISADTAEKITQACVDFAKKNNIAVTVIRSICFSFLAIFPAFWPLYAADAQHPLDALTVPEYWATYEAMKASGKLDAASRFAGITLHEPPKAEVLRWKPGEPFRRESLAIIKQGRRTFEATVNSHSILQT